MPRICATCQPTQTCVPGSKIPTPQFATIANITAVIANNFHSTQTACNNAKIAPLSRKVA